MKIRIRYYKPRENLYQYYNKSHENPYQVLQVMWAASECAMKSKVRVLKMIINIVQTYTNKNITRLLPLVLLLMLYTHNNTDGSKLVIFSRIALYYGETYMQTVWASP